MDIETVNEIYELCDELSNLYRNMARDRFETPTNERKYSDELLAEVLYKNDLTFWLANLINLEVIDIDTLTDEQISDIQDLVRFLDI